MNLQLYHLSYLHLFQDVNLTISQPGLYLLYGQSGSGKTTFLHILSSLITDYQGEVIINGHSTKNKKTFDHTVFYSSLMGIMFQNEYLIQEYTLEENFMLFNYSREMIDSVLEKVGLKGIKQKVENLSLGQKQRACLALLYLSKPEIILLDEPTSALDHESIELCLSLIREMAKDSIVIICTHQKEIYLPYSDGVMEIKNQQIIPDLPEGYDLNHTYHEPFRISIRQKIKLHLLHLRRYLFSYLKIMLIFIIPLLLVLLITEVDTSFNTLYQSYTSRYPDYLCLAVSNVSLEEITQVSYDYCINKKENEGIENIGIISNKVLLKEGNMPERGEILISEDCGMMLGDHYIIEGQEYIVKGIVDNSLIQRQIYLVKEDYEALSNEGEGYLLLFHDYDELSSSLKELEKNVYILIDQDYLNFVENYSLLENLSAAYLKGLLVFILMFLCLLLYFDLYSLLQRLKVELINLYLHGMDQKACRHFYLEEIMLLVLTSMILTAMAFPVILKKIRVLVYTYLLHLDFLIEISKLIELQGKTLLIEGILLILSAYLISTLILTLFMKESITRLVKENEGC